MPTAILLKVLGFGLVLLGLAWHLKGDKDTKEELQSAKEEIVVLQGKLDHANYTIEQLSRDKAAVEAQVAQANEQRTKIQASLRTALKDLAKQQVPVECGEAIDFAVEHKDDLAW
jgi:septal ring factor EnvC (AmiA/AmiB activator)